jgi:hypothetical protein
MEIKKSDRATLKSYFVRNAKPSAANFAELIDGLLNQREDGIAKLPGEPLSLQADGADASLKKAINFYRNFADPRPAWTLCLNPRPADGEPRNAQPGWSLGDADGTSKLFIDQSSGAVGIGTIKPAYRLHVPGGNAVFNAAFAGDVGHGATWAGFGHASAVDKNGYALLQSADGRSTLLNKKGGDGYIGLRIDNADRMVLDKNGNVGIGTTAPATALEIRREAQGALGPVLRLTNGIGYAGAGAALDLNSYDTKEQPPTARIQSVDDGNFSSALTFSTKRPGNTANELVEALRIASDGAISIGSTEKRARLDIAQAERTDKDKHPAKVKALYVTGDFGALNDGVEFRHSNGSQGIGFGYNTIYATGYRDQDLQLMPKNGWLRVKGKFAVDPGMETEGVPVVDFQTQSGSFANYSGSAKVLTYVFKFSRPVLKAEPMLQSWWLGYGNREFVKEIGMACKVTSISDKVVTVDVTFHLKDLSGNFDDPYWGSAHVTVIAHLKQTL